jgi:C-terminal processing protease CtpA/Prc
VQELRQSFETLLVSLKDKHGKFYDPASTSGIAEYPFHNSPYIPNPGELSAVKSTEFYYQNLPNSIHYIRLVASPSDGDFQKHADVVRQAIDSLSKEDEPYWIVDLRYAVDGEINSFFAGMAPLLGEGLIASTMDGEKQIRNLYTVHNGNFHDNQVRIGKFPISIEDTHNLKIAVLTSRYTSGSAEVLALAFRGRKESKLFGEETAGQIAGTTQITISNKVVMSISEIMYTDRKGTSYTDSVTPHTIVEFIPGVDVNQDRAISEASLWLTTTPVAQNGTKVTMK